MVTAPGVYRPLPHGVSPAHPCGALPTWFQLSFRAKPGIVETLCRSHGKIPATGTLAENESPDSSLPALRSQLDRTGWRPRCARVPKAGIASLGRYTIRGGRPLLSQGRSRLGVVNGEQGWLPHDGSCPRRNHPLTGDNRVCRGGSRTAPRVTHAPPPPPTDAEWPPPCREGATLPIASVPLAAGFGWRYGVRVES